jgi:membrane protease YdiL (CAAX protease family)
MPLRDAVWNDRDRRPTAPVRLCSTIVVFVVSLVGVNVLLAVAGIGGEGTGSGVNFGIRLLGISLPGVVVLGAAVAFDRRRLSDFGLSVDWDWWADFAFGLGLATGLLAGVFAVSLAAGWLRVTDTFTVTADAAFEGFVPNVAALVVFFVFVGVSEELVARGYLLVNVAEGLTFVDRLGVRGAVGGGVLVSAVVFGALHASNPNSSLISTVGLMIAGLLYAAGYVFTGRLALPIGFHIAWNVAEGLIFGFPVSGSRQAASVLAVAEQGPDLLTGGAFGPEAGVLGVGSRIVGVLCIVGYVRLRYGSVSLADGLTEPSLR